MVRVSFDQKPYRRAMMETYGATCVASPSEETNAGRTVLAERPDSTGSLGIAIGEAVEEAATRDDTNYALGSVLNHVLMHQSVIGREALAQFELADDYPDIIVGCTGGGSNFAGVAFPFIGEKLRGGPRRAGGGGGAGRVSVPHPGEVRLRLRRHREAHPAGEDAHPRLGLRALGLPCRGAALSRDGAAGEPLRGARPGSSRPRTRSWSASKRASGSARTESIVPAPEANHAVKGVIVEALRCREEGTSRAILFNLCGHGHFDMQAYTDYFAGNLGAEHYDEGEVAMALAGLPAVA